MLRVTRSLAVSMLALGCAPVADTPPPTTAESAQPVDGDQVMRALEQRLQAAQQVDLTFEIESTGAVICRFSGTLHWVRDGDLSLRTTGVFDGVEQDLELRGDADTLATFVSGEQVWAGPRPAALIEAIVLGLTRQGLLHNLAMLSVGGPPERGEGGIGEWLTFTDARLGPPLEFGIEVEGQEVGRASLWTDAAGLPVERHQTVEFPGGAMQVVERYPESSIID
jgi:hypothetical protein